MWMLLIVASLSRCIAGSAVSLGFGMYMNGM